MAMELHASLEALLEAVPRDELARIVARRGRVSAEAFLEALHADLDGAIERLEAAARHYAGDDVEKLTGFLVAQLASAGYDATCEVEDRESVGLKIENRAAKVVWLAAADLYRDVADSAAGILWLFCRHAGRRPHAGFLLYIRRSGAAEIVERWKAALQSDPRLRCHAVMGSPVACVFTSVHTHPLSGFPVELRHHAVLLDPSLDEALDRAAAAEPLAFGATDALRLHATSPKTQTILFLAASPSEADRLALDREARAIQVELERSQFRDRFELVTRWAAEPFDLLRELRKLKPAVVHFSGHGGVDGDGLFFQSPDGRARLVPTQALEEAFGAAGGSTELVVLSACYSEAQAEALLAHAGCVVAMSGALSGEAARSFATGFYGGLGDGASIDGAYRQGCAAISLEGLSDAARPQLKVRAGSHAARLVLATDHG